MNAIPYKLRHKLHEVFFIEPNDLGFYPMTVIYKVLTSYLKQMPFLFIIPLSLAGAIIMYLLLGTFLVKLVSLLQYGF